ncbi:hypothetical protein Tco_0304768 [Tanacetum coccineum]
MFTKQSILGKPPSSSYKPKLYSVTPFPKSSVLPKVDKTNALSKPVTSNSAPSTRESKVVQTVNVISPRIFRTNPSKTSRVDNVVPNKPVKTSVRIKPITVSQPNVIHKQQADFDSNGFSSTRVNNTAKTRRPHLRSNSNTDRVPSKSKITANHDVCVLNYVNDMNSRADNQSANVSIRENHKKHKANAKKSKELGSKGSLASSRPSKPRTCLRWIPTGRIFAMCGKLTASSNTENKSEKSVRDNASTSNPSEPLSKGFSISTSLLGRLSRLRKQHTSIYPIDAKYTLGEVYDSPRRSIQQRLGKVYNKGQAKYTFGNLKGQLNKETLHEKDSNSDLSVIKVQFDLYIHSKVLEPSNYNSYELKTRQDFKAYTNMQAQTFKETIIQNMDSIEQCIVERARHEQELQNRLKRLSERKLQIQECKIQEVKASIASSRDKDSSGIVLDKGNDQGLDNQRNTSGDESSRSRNECNDKSTYGDDTDIRHSNDTEPMVEVSYTAEYNVFAVDTQHSEQPEYIINTCVVEKVDSNVIPDSPDMCDNEIQIDQNAIQKQLKKANALLTQELKECKSTLVETSRTLGESNSILDSCLVALQNKQAELEKYMTCNDCTVDYDKLERKLNETLGLLVQKEIDIKEGLKLKAYEILVVKEKQDELVKQSILTKSHYEGLVKEKTKEKHSHDHFHAPTALDMEVLIKTCLMPLAIKTQNDSFIFVHELKQEMHADLKHRFASQVGVSHDLTKPVTPHSWPQVRKLSFAKPYDVKAPDPSRKSPKHVSFQSPREYVGSNDMVPIGQKFSLNKSSNVYLKTTPPRSGLTWKPTGRIFTRVVLKWILIRKSVETCYNTNDSASPLEKKTHNPNTTICANSSSLIVGESNTSVLEDLTLKAGNPVKEILLN